jgi:hypothetical protein
MATQLKNIVRFVNVVPGATVALPHGLAISPPGGGEIPQVPDILIPSGPGFAMTANATNVSVTNETAVVRSVDVIAEHWHSVERAFGDAAVLDLVPQPFVVDLGADLLNLAGGVLGWGVGVLGADVGTDYLWPWYGQDVQDAGGEQGRPIEIHAPRPGTIRNFYARHNTANGNSAAVVYTLFVNGAPTALSASLATGATGFATDLADSIAVAQGDLLSVRAVKAAPINNPGVDTELRTTVTMRFDA